MKTRDKIIQANFSASTGVLEVNKKIVALRENQQGYYLQLPAGKLRVQANTCYLQDSINRYYPDIKVGERVAMIGRFVALIAETNQKGEICKRTNRGRKIMTWQDIVATLELSEKRAKSLVNKYINLGWISKIIEKDIADDSVTLVRYVVNYPAVEVTRGRYNLQVDGFLRNHTRIRESGALSKSVISMFEAVYSEYYLSRQLENGSETEIENDYDTIFSEYILRGKDADVYHLKDGGLRAGYDNVNCFYLVQESEKEGQRKAKDIKTYRNLYLDIDAGRRNGEYLPLEEVAEIKADILDTLLDGSLPTPTAVVDTRNGYHAIYSISATTDVNAWRDAQLALVNAYNIADNLKDGSRVLRMPNTVWDKENGKYGQYDVSIKVAHPVRYDIADFQDMLEANMDSIKENVAMLTAKYDTLATTETKQATVNTTAPADVEYSNVDLHVALVEAFEKNIKKYNVNRNNLFQALKKINPIEIFELDKHVAMRDNKLSCIFHDDSNPSACVYQDANGNYFYKCFSANCDCHDTIMDNIDIYAHLTGLNLAASCGNIRRALMR